MVTNIKEPNLVAGFYPAVTSIFHFDFTGNKATGSFDGYVYRFGSDFVSMIQENSGNTWTIDVDYFPSGVTPTFASNQVSNSASGYYGYLSFRTLRGRVTSAISLFVEFTSDVNATVGLTAVPGSHGGTIVPILYLDSAPWFRQAQGYVWTTSPSWSISGIALGTSAANALVSENADGATAEMHVMADSETSINTDYYGETSVMEIGSSLSCEGSGDEGGSDTGRISSARRQSFVSHLRFIFIVSVWSIL